MIRNLGSARCWADTFEKQLKISVRRIFRADKTLTSQKRAATLAIAVHQNTVDPHNFDAFLNLFIQEKQIPSLVIQKVSAKPQSNRLILYSPK